MVMRASKAFIVVAYDISDNKRRNKVARLLRQYGVPVNMSVFECMLTEIQLNSIIEKIGKIINYKNDRIIYYRMCLNCYTKILYQPDRIRNAPEISGIV